MKNNYLKILSVLFCMVALVVTLALPCFADTTDTITIDVSRLPNRSYDYSTPVLTLPAYTNYTILVDGEQVYTGGIESVTMLDSINSVTYELNDENGVTYSFRFGAEDINNYDPFLTYNGDAVDTVTFIADGIEYDPDYPFVIGTGENPVVGGITGVFSNISGFVVSSLGMLQGVFYDGTNLTMLGTLALIGLAIGVAFLIVGVIQSFLRLRG